MTYSVVHLVEKKDGVEQVQSLEEKLVKSKEEVSKLKNRLLEKDKEIDSLKRHFQQSYDGKKHTCAWGGGPHSLKKIQKS